ncbi:transposase [Clostridium sp.]|uniref:IS110 family transposase n=1 Tax=Clostridium sp. TaxID=1506 RepID=UPI002A86E071|nr:transposase [Clostridium sp.]
MFKYFSYLLSSSLEEILIGIESTGHYWINFYEFFTKRDYEVVMVKNRVVKLKREAKYSQKGKNDSKSYIIENFPSARALQAYFGLSIRADMSVNMVK